MSLNVKGRGSGLWDEVVLWEWRWERRGGEGARAYEMGFEHMRWDRVNLDNLDFGIVFWSCVD